MASQQVLTLGHFLDPDCDYERRQYEILSILKSRYFAAFNKNILYPPLRELIDLLTVLQDFLNKKDSAESKFPKELRLFDIEHQKTIYNLLVEKGDALERVAELMEWGFPEIERIAHEGARLFDFVDENLTFEQFGLYPAHDGSDDGFWLVPDTHEKSDVMRVFLYSRGIYGASKDRYRSFRLRSAGMLSAKRLERTPASLRARLRKGIPEFARYSNPPVYLCECGFSFPLVETVLPVAKRKFIKEFAS